MSEVSKPEGWEEARLDDVAQLVRGITFPTTAKGHEPREGAVACLRTANVQAEVEWGDLWYVPRDYVKHDEQYVQSGDVLISTANSYELVGKVAQVKAPHQEASLGAFISLLRAEAGVCSTYFYYLMSSDSIQRAIREMASTTTNLSNVSGGKLKELQLLIAPSAEQTRIVEKLEELLSDLDAGVAELKAAQRKLAQYRQSLLKAAVEGALTADWRAARAQAGEPQETGAELLQRIVTERRARWEASQLARFAEQGKNPPKGWQAKYKEPLALDTADLPALPDGWAWASVDQLTDFVTSGSRGWAAYYAESGATFIRSQNINKDWLDLSDIAFVSPPANAEGARTRVQQGDLLLTITGANVGKCAWVSTALDEAYVSQHVALIRLVETALGKYLHLFLTCKGGGRGQLDEEAYGAGKPGLNLQQVLAVTIPIPNPSELRQILVAVASTMDAATDQVGAVETALKQSAAQRKNILKAAFAGQLVPQDPNDEPASVLLELILAERAASRSTRMASKVKVRHKT